MTYSIVALDQVTGDLAAAGIARARSLALAPEDDQVVPWSAVGLAMAGRIDEARAAVAAASAVEPRSGEHLRRFAEAGHLPGGEETLRRLGLASIHAFRSGRSR